MLKSSHSVYHNPSYKDMLVIHDLINTDPQTLRLVDTATGLLKVCAHLQGLNKNVADWAA